MSYIIDKVDVWAATVEDRPGTMAEKLKTLAAGGVNLEMIVARRMRDQPSQGLVLVAPIAGAAQSRAAKNAGFTKAEQMHSLRLEGADKPGLAARISQALAQAGINLKGFSGVAIGRKAIAYFSFDSKDDQKKAIGALKKLLK